MAYVGCIAGAILIEDYRRMLVEAGFAHVEVIDSGRDLNAYAKVENQAGCCPPPAVRLCRSPRRVVARQRSTSTPSVSTFTIGSQNCCPATT